MQDRERTRSLPRRVAAALAGMTVGLRGRARNGRCRHCTPALLPKQTVVGLAEHLPAQVNALAEDLPCDMRVILQGSSRSIHLYGSH